MTLMYENFSETNKYHQTEVRTKKTKQQRVKGRLSAEIRSKYYDTKYVSISTSMWFTGVLWVIHLPQCLELVKGRPCVGGINVAQRF